MAKVGPSLSVITLHGNALSSQVKRKNMGKEIKFFKLKNLHISGLCGDTCMQRAHW